MNQIESKRRRLAALDKIRGISPATRETIETLTNANREHGVVTDAAQMVLNDLQRRVDAVEARQGRDALAERERMSSRLGRSFNREAAA